MGRTGIVKDLIMKELMRSGKGKRDLKRVVKAKDPKLKNHTKRALKKLVQKGLVEKNGKFFQLAEPKDHSSILDQTQDAAQQHEGAALPIAAILRKEQHIREIPTKKGVSFADEQLDLDDEIRKLEAELNQPSDGTSDDEGSTSSSVDDDEPRLLSLSSFANDRIDHLPKTLLPEPGKYKEQGPSASGARKRPASKDQDKNNEKIDGLKEAVKEVLSGYKPRSSERLPFYCRFCSKQYENETEFFAHKNSDFHKTAAAMERKATYCRLCQKQLTSPEQMKEHLMSRPHRERLQKVRSRQAMNGKCGNNKGNRGEMRQWT